MFVLPVRVGFFVALIIPVSYYLSRDVFFCTETKVLISDTFIY
jgi:hypothetical protein